MPYKEVEMPFSYWGPGGKAGRKLKKERPKYVLFIDLGSYRTSVLCWPQHDMNIAMASRYIVQYKSGDEYKPSWPSAFVRPIGNENGADTDFQFIEDIVGCGIDKEQLVVSAKFLFTREFSQYPDGNVPDFKLYMRKVIEGSLQYIMEYRKESVWNSDSVPLIEEIRVTVPDLFIENLRDGYKKTILEVCRELDPMWRVLFANLEGDNLNFVKISTDESGACELYFVNLLKDMPFWDLSSDINRAVDVDDVRWLFSQNESVAKNKLIFAICHLDIGGLTTDASCILVKTGKAEDHSIISSTLWKKQSFDKRRAGEWLGHEFRGKRYYKEGDVWWDSHEFLVETFTPFIKSLIVEQADLLKKWRSEKVDIDGIYYLISGRPTRAELVQQQISRLIIQELNRDGLYILPEHLMFMSHYRHFGREPSTHAPYLIQIPDFEKLITSVGNTYTLRMGYDLDREYGQPSYYIYLESDYKSVVPHKIPESASLDTGTLVDFKYVFERQPSINLLYGKLPYAAPSWLPFMSAAKQDKELIYPVIRIRTYDQTERAWIMPSIYIENFTENSNIFSLKWTNEEHVYDDLARLARRRVRR